MDSMFSRALCSINILLPIFHLPKVKISLILPHHHHQKRKKKKKSLIYSLMSLLLISAFLIVPAEILESGQSIVR